MEIYISGTFFKSLLSISTYSVWLHEYLIIQNENNKINKSDVNEKRML